MKALMIQGATSDAGKSVLVAGLCRLLANRGVKVAPFKPQNMALNSAVTIDGGEIGRAQALQAQAANITPTTDMNPVLLKPNTDIGSQVIIHGRVHTHMDARAYHAYKPQVMPYVLDSFSRLQQTYDCVIIEGAGSPAEINLREHDIANMGFAEAADVPVIIVADIERGGVFAHLYGTLALLSTSEQARVKGFVINRFRGDPSLLDPGIEWLEQKTGKPVLGVLPYITDLSLEAEDSVGIDARKPKAKTSFRVVVPIISRISNHTDFDPLREHPEIEIEFVHQGESLPACDLIILPGTKSVRSALQDLREQGWDRDIERHLRYGGKVLGICGGYQMLGREIDDRLGIEGEAGSSVGLGHLDITTQLQREKSLQQVSGYLHLPQQDAIQIVGYEIHAGVTELTAKSSPIRLRNSNNIEYSDGALSADNQVFGTYVHGILDSGDALDAIMRWAGARLTQRLEINDRREQSLQRLARLMETHIDLDRLSL